MFDINPTDHQENLNTASIFFVNLTKSVKLFVKSMGLREMISCLRQNSPQPDYGFNKHIQGLSCASCLVPGSSNHKEFLWKDSGLSGKIWCCCLGTERFLGVWTTALHWFFLCIGLPLTWERSWPSGSESDDCELAPESNQCGAWALKKNLYRPSFFLYFREIRKKRSHWPDDLSASRLYNRNYLCPCARPALVGEWGPWPVFKFSKTVEVGWSCSDLQLCQRVIATDQIQERKKYRERSTINARISVHWRAQYHAKWSRGSREFQ